MGGHRLDSTRTWIRRSHVEKQRGKDRVSDRKAMSARTAKAVMGSQMFLLRLCFVRLCKNNNVVSDIPGDPATVRAEI